MGHNAKGAGFALLAFAIYATHDVVVKTLGGQYASFQIVFFSVLFGFPLAMLALIQDVTPGTLRPVHPWWSLARVAAAVCAGFNVFYAFSVLPLAQTYAILFSAPLLVTVFAIPILGERVRLRRWTAVIIGLCGVLVVVQPGNAELGLGHLAAFIAAISSALASVIVRKIGREERAIVLMLYPMLANFCVMAVLMPFVYKPMPIEHLGLTALMSVFAFIGANLMIQAYRRGEAVIVAPMQYSQIVWAILFGALIFGEHPTTTTLIGAAIVVGSGLYIVLREGRMHGDTQAPVLRTRSRFETGTFLRIGPLLRLRERRSAARERAGPAAE
ncbi:membrane protein [Oceanicola sp. 22II-s10i]|uniref:DMT family transporter n=1 Tax=Oceanicola sp. 22II-s10i TaxID=1317116 RepID=UPI000B527D5B|nr:DMT family transporter [Oceanicola sp. 22II-s10i]OWU86161.1 membrane protein [Oceanicola sp. 22II-s10i]